MRTSFRALLLGLLSLISLSAQVSGRVSGAVVDSSGAAVPGAQVDLLLSGGKRALLSTKTGSDGSYNFIAVRPADYDLTVDAKGFVKATVHGIVVDAAKETSVPEVKLQLPSVTQTLDVNADIQTVEVSSAEIAGTISMDEIRSLPILDRDPLGVLQTQAGVTYNGNSNTTINGLRTSYSNVTLDGINIQDNYIRDNALDYTPNKLLLGQVRQMTLISSNPNAAAAGGATETAFSTPSGTNQFHGEAFWYNRNNYFAANDWFSNQSGVERSFLNQNQFGVSVGGPILRDKLFFYSNYEALRLHQQVPVVNTILTQSARQGIFTYNVNGAPRTVNLLSLRNLPGVDPTVQALIDQTPPASAINTNVVGDGRNLGGYRFNQRDQGTRDNITGKIDYNLSTTHAISGSYLWNRYNSDRPDAENDFSVIPKVYNPTHSNFVAASWRWTPSAHLTNEVRGGFNLTYGYFNSSQNFGKYILTGMPFSNPVNEFQTQGRTTNTFVLSDDAAWQHGHHYVQFGFNAQKIYVETYDKAGTVPVYTLAMGTGQPALTRTNVTGASQDDLAIANSILASLGGYLDTYAQTFNVTSRTSGFVPSAPYLRHLRLPDYGLYVQDKWRVFPRLTLTLGLRWSLPGVADERDSLELQPILTGTLEQTLLSNATLDYAGKSAGRPLYNRALKDFNPNIGFAWDVFGNGKMAIRGGYAITRVNDQELIAVENMLSSANSGLQGFAADTGSSSRVGTGVPAIPAPAFKVPLTVADEYASNPFNTIGSVDPNLNRPYVQQYSIGVQRDVKGVLLEARYVGNHVVGAYRAFDFNQVQIKQNGFLDDFIRARNNGFLAQNRTGTFNPVFNPQIPGSQPLTVFPQLDQGGHLTNADVRFYLETGETAELGTLYQTNGWNGNLNFFPNPYALGADMLTNYSSSSYNSLQLVARRRLKNGLTFEGNYTFSKVLSDGDGDLQSRFQAFLDLNNPGLERSRANFDLNHAIKAYGEYDLPFGKGHKLSSHLFDRLIGGWKFSTVMVWQSGAPFSILSDRGTLNREARSYYNTASTTLNGAQLSQVVKFQMTGNGPLIVSPSAINPNDGSGVNTDGEGAFSGQVFLNPGPGQLGTLQRRQFSGPWTFNIDASVSKTIPIKERQNVLLRMDAFNAINHATFWSGDQFINTTTFGLMNSTFYLPRIMEFGLYYRF